MCVNVICNSVHGAVGVITKIAIDIVTSRGSPARCMITKSVYQLVRSTG